MFGMKCRESALRFAGNLITELKEGRISTDNPCTYIEYYYYYCGVVGAWCGGGERATRSAILNTLYESPCVSPPYPPYPPYRLATDHHSCITTHVSPPVYHLCLFPLFSFPFLWPLTTTRVSCSLSLFSTLSKPHTSISLNEFS